MKVNAAYDWSENSWGSFYEDQPRNIIIPPYGGEFGWFCSHWVRQVNQIKADSLIVCCKKDEEIFYPNATDFYSDYDNTVWPELPQGMGKEFVWEEQNKILEKALLEKPHWRDYIIFRPSKGWEYSMDLNHPVTLTPDLDIKVDLVLSARNCVADGARSKKTFTNIDVDTLPLDELQELGITIGLIGTIDGTLDLPNVSIKSYSFDKPNHASVSMMQNCKLALVQNTGVMHLASLCDSPTVVFGRHKTHMVEWAARQRSSKSFFRYMGGELNDKNSIYNYVKKYFEDLPEKRLNKHYSF